MGLSGPDAVLLRWLELRAELEAPPSSAGRWCGTPVVRPSPYCARCGADAVTWRQDPLVSLRDAEAVRATHPGRRLAEDEEPATVRAICRNCGAPWLLEILSFLGSSETPPWSHRLSELRELGLVLEAALAAEVHRRLYGQLYLLERVGDLEAVAEEANRRWPQMAPPVRGPSGPRSRVWSRHAARLVVCEARERIALEMMARGLWRFA